ncbi:MAG: hypothetical protein AAF701_08395 [Pseudomonadota bacterium]
MTTTVLDIWAYPKNGVLPDFTAFLECHTMDDMALVPMPWLDGTFLDIPGDAELPVEQVLRDELQKAGLPFGTETMDPPPWGARISMWAFRILDRVWDVFDSMRFSVSKPRADDHVFPMWLPIGSTHPTWDLNHDYDVIDAETKRYRDAVAAQITQHRGVRPQSFADTGLFDPDDDNHARATLANVTHYWPPVDGKPSLALSEVQEDGGLPVEITLLVQDAAGHAYVMALCGHPLDTR